MFNHKQQKGEGNAKRKSNRYSILMLALIFIGFATYGTYAYFTDSTSVVTDIELTAGTVSLGEAVSNEGWVYDYTTFGNGYNRNLSLSGNNANNLQPGDAYTKTVAIKYLGSLDAVVNFEGIQDVVNTVKNANFDVLIKVTKNESEVTNFESIEVANNDTLKVIITVGLKTNDNQENYSATDKNTRNYSTGLELKDLTKNITITAKQKNASSESK
ncbi:hypothetical protein [Enterococcus sp.]|uniref:hypothetical protein n=1 Tax=Enterococcus sp. TaxID=35783 RepID=UPI0028A8AACF|nr:hypothetical protein [Enterococcus sp.]